MAVFQKQGPKQDWPAWRVSPDGSTRQLFEKAADVPEGWTSRRAELKAALVDDEGHAAPSEILRPKRAQWPAWRVSPDGSERRIFQNPESVPVGWYSRREGPPKVVEAAPLAEAETETEAENDVAHTEIRRTPLKLKRKVPNDNRVGADSAGIPGE